MHKSVCNRRSRLSQLKRRYPTAILQRDVPDEDRLWQSLETRQNLSSRMEASDESTGYQPLSEADTDKQRMILQRYGLHHLDEVSRLAHPYWLKESEKAMLHRSRTADQMIFDTISHTGQHSTYRASFKRLRDQVVESSHTNRWASARSRIGLRIAFSAQKRRKHWASHYFKGGLPQPELMRPRVRPFWYRCSPVSSASYTDGKTA